MIMKKILALLTMALCLVGCNGPEDCVRGFCDAACERDMDEMITYTTGDAKTLFSMINADPSARNAFFTEIAIGQSGRVDPSSYKIIACTEDGNEAAVRVYSAGDRSVEKYLLKKVKGEWKIYDIISD